jgi:alkylation response protein AidB-like acyl-CoA dehydrogenase
VSDDRIDPFLNAARSLAPQIRESAEAIERERRLPVALIEAMATAGLFRLWIPRSLGGAETDPMTLVRVVEEISRADGAAGWCVALAGEYGVFGGYLPPEAAREIYGRDPKVFTCGALRPMGEAIVVDGGYRVTGRWPLGSGCHHASWIVGGCRIVEAGQARLSPDGTPAVRQLFFPAHACEIIDTWHSIGLRGTGSHDYAVRDLFVPTSHALSFREPPVERGPLYAFPTIALFATALAAVPLGVAQHAIELLTELARTKIASRSRRPVGEDATIQADLGRAEAILRSARAFLYETLNEAWRAASAANALDQSGRALLWLAATHAANCAKQVADLMFSAGGSASPYVAAGLERCVRDIYAAAQHVTLAPPNYQLAGQAFLGSDMRGTLLFAFDDRGAA